MDASQKQQTFFEFVCESPEYKSVVYNGNDFGKRFDQMIQGKSSYFCSNVQITPIFLDILLDMGYSFSRQIKATIESKPTNYDKAAEICNTPKSSNHYAAIMIALLETGQTSVLAKIDQIGIPRLYEQYLEKNKSK